MKKSMIIFSVLLLGSLVLPAIGQNIKNKSTEEVAHIVLFKFKEGATAGQLQSLNDEILKQKGTVPGLLEVSFGEDFTGRAKGFTHAEVAVFKDRKSLEDFSKSAYHQQLIATYIKPVLEDILVFDYQHQK